MAQNSEINSSHLHPSKKMFFSQFNKILQNIANSHHIFSVYAVLCKKMLKNDPSFGVFLVDHHEWEERLASTNLWETLLWALFHVWLSQ